MSKDNDCLRAVKYGLGVDLKWIRRSGNWFAEVGFVGRPWQGTRERVRGGCT